MSICTHFDGRQSVNRTRVEHNRIFVIPKKSVVLLHFLCVTSASTVHSKPCVIYHALPEFLWICYTFFLFSVTCSIWHERQQNGSTEKSAQNSDETQRWLEKCSNQQLFELSKNCTNLSHRNAFFACGTLLELDATSSSSLSIIIMEMLSILVSIYFGHFSNWNLTCSSISIGFFFCCFLFRYHLVISVSFHLAWCVSDGCVLDFMPSVCGINLFATQTQSASSQNA